MAMDVGDFEGKDSQMPFAAVDLHPGNGSGGGGAALPGKLLGAGKRLTGGESLFTTVYTNQRSTTLRPAFAARCPGKVATMALRQLRAAPTCRNGAFLSAAGGVSLGVVLPCELPGGVTGGEGFIMQRLGGAGE